MERRFLVTHLKSENFSAVGCNSGLCFSFISPKHLSCHLKALPTFDLRWWNICSFWLHHTAHCAVKIVISTHLHVGTVLVSSPDPTYEERVWWLSAGFMLKVVSSEKIKGLKGFSIGFYYLLIYSWAPNCHLPLPCLHLLIVQKQALYLSK